MSNLAVETCDCLVFASRFGRGFFGPRGVLRKVRNRTLRASSRRVAPIAAALMVRKIRHSSSGMAIIIPRYVSAISCAIE